MPLPVDHAEREEIRTALDANLCVEAGAGTGKTTSLVERIVEVLASGRADAESLAVITFTEKAAAELSARVRERLEEALREAEGDGTDPERAVRLREAARCALPRADRDDPRVRREPPARAPGRGGRRPRASRC